MALVQLKLQPPSGIGGLIQGAYGTYQPNTDGTYTIDSRDAPPLLTLGWQYLPQYTLAYNTPVAPAAATTGEFVASAALSDGALTVANQPDVLRQANVVIGAGTAAITAGEVTVVFIGNDGVTTTQNVSAILASGAVSTNSLSKAIAHISSAYVGGLAGGGSPYVRIDSTSALGVPVPPNAVDVSFLKEDTNAGDEAVGTPVSGVLGTITPTTAPNGTHTFSWLYSSIAPAT